MEYTHDSTGLRGTAFNNISLLRHGNEEHPPRTIKLRERRMRSLSETGEGPEDTVQVILLFLFNSMSAEFTSWSITDTADDSLVASAATGDYSALSDATELISLIPGRNYRFTISDASSSDTGSNTKFAVVFYEPSFSLASGDINSGTVDSVTFYVPLKKEVTVNDTLPSCANNWESCKNGSDCCTGRCSPEDHMCYPKSEDDRDQASGGDHGGAGAGIIDPLVWFYP